jgi:phosphate:Na+ symporter
MGIENILSLIGGLAIGNFERIADHCSNIAITVMQMKNGSIGQHGYKEFADREGSAYHTLFLGYQAQFALPESGRKEA